MNRLAVAGLAGVVLAGVACGGGRQLIRQSGEVGDLVATARDHGAVRCAPVEFAMAESHHDFARQDLDEGNYYRAREELAVAEDNARAAIRKSPKARCNPEVASAPEPEPTPEDSDGDGLLDPDDECPQRPEDKDGYRDDDGCPDDDNDNDGLADRVDDCPDDPEDEDAFEDDDGCPDKDNDADGLADMVDQCPNKPEDKDGFEDDDGCPDCDNDGDGVPECPTVVDKCPDKAAETDDGCPEYKNVVVTEKKIEIKQTIYFDTAKATIKPVSHSILDEVVQALTDHKDIRVRIEGHTDSRGGEEYNRKLSDARASSVRDYLIQKGIASDRLVSHGYGERRPIADNRTAAGREQNRRVEFVIIGN